MKIIDMRVRPPYKSFKKGRVFNVKKQAGWCKRFNLTTPASNAAFSMDMFYDECKEAGVVKVGVPGLLADGILNDDIAELAENNPDFFMAFPEINPWNKEKALQDIDKYVINGVCTGINMELGFASPKPLYAEDGLVYPIYEKCEENSIPILLSYGGLIGKDFSYCDPIHIAHVVKDFPMLKVLLCHAAWPFAREAVHLAFKNENVYLQPDMYSMNVVGGEDYLIAANSMLKEQIVFASAYPIFAPKDIAERYIQWGLQPEVLQNVLHDNALRFLNMQI